jgi:hypothetical protein
MILKPTMCFVVAGILACLGIGCSVQAAPGIFPSAVGSQWRYRVSNGPQYSDKIIAASAGSFTVLYRGAATYRMHWIKKATGWTTPDFRAVGAVHPVGESFKTHVTGSGGVVVPHTGLWKRAYRWNFWYTMRTTGSTGPMTFTQTGKITVHNRITGMKVVHVPAGSFKCFVVRSAVIFTGTEAVAGQTIPLHVTTAETQYYALGVGLIKRKDGETTTVLTKFTPGK